MNVTSKTYPVEYLMDAAEMAAEQVGIRLYNLREVGRSGHGIAFTLKTGEPLEYRADWRGKLVWSPKYQIFSRRENYSTDRKYYGRPILRAEPGRACLLARGTRLPARVIQQGPRRQSPDGPCNVSRPERFRGGLS